MGKNFEQPKLIKENVKSNSEKKFVFRNSVLTDVFQSKNGKIIYTIYITIFITLFLNHTVVNYIKLGELNFGMKCITAGFKNYHLTILTWFVFFGIVCFGFFLFTLWARYARKDSRIWNIASFAFLIGFYIFEFHLCAYLIRKFDMGHASAAFIATEQIRLSMKLHAFIRSNLWKTETNTPLPPFSYFIEFLFFPTLVYRDSYPRTTIIDYKFALTCLLEIASSIFIFSYTLEPLFKSSVHKFGTNETFKISDIIVLIFSNFITAISILLICFFLVLHSLQNFFAEITRFGDRQFYTDWWNATDFSEWFRTWNIVVHDWLYLYIYKDSMRYVARDNRIVAKCFVFAISAIVHEWVLTSALGFWFPILFVQFFVFGGIFSSFRLPKNVLSSALLLYGICMGLGSLLTLYAIEFFIRFNRGHAGSMPAIFTCDCISF